MEIHQQTLQNHFGINSFRIGQKEIISAVLDGQDVMAVLPTGGGKSLCYQLPALVTGKLVVVISPLIALMKDQVFSLQRLGIPSGRFHSGQSDDEKREVFQAIKKGGAFVLYLSPERAQKEGFQTWIKQQDIALFAVDEAHCVSQWGHDFRSEYSQLYRLKELCPEVPVLALTASATPLVLKDIEKNLKLNRPQRMVYGFYRPNLYYQVEFCQDEDEKNGFIHGAIAAQKTGKILVYCGTRKMTEEVSSQLQKYFDGVGFYHAGLSMEARNETQELFEKGSLRILVATNAFGMGIDRPDVRLVVHYQMPANIDALYQEMGRAGRDGLPSTCLMLYSKKDKGLQSFFITSSEANAEIKKLRWRTLDALTNYAETKECRHGEILTYFKDTKRLEICGHCDSCSPDSGQRVQRPVKVVKAKTVKVRKARDRGEVTVHLDPSQELRFQALKKWRKAKAQELDVPAFVVFSDRTLQNIAMVFPETLDQLKQVHGIGEQKLEQFGWDLLAELNGT